MMLAAAILALGQAELEEIERSLTESTGPLLVEVESARLAIEDALRELKKKELPAAFEGEEDKAWRFRVARDFLPRAERLLSRRPPGEPAGSWALLEAHAASWRRGDEAWTKAPFPASLVEAARASFGALKKRHAALLAEDAAAALRWMERQIRELYEPLVRLNAQGAAAIKGYTRLNTDDAEQARWKVWAERSFLPRNEETRRVVAAGLAFIEGEAVSETFLAFLEHQISWAWRHRRWELEKGDYEWGSRTNWPVAFSVEVEGAYQRLLDRRARLVSGGK